uniref:Uncharacterized protein n=1 Tax=Leptobrachium leishanense TaxID=445787 RepID=A0A8C5QEQ9_9ANUR
MESVLQNPDPKTEELIQSIKRLERAKELLSDALDEHKAQCEGVMEELEKLNVDRQQVAELYGKKQETLRVLQLQCDETVSYDQRQQQLSGTSKDRIENLTTQKQEEKLKQRKQRLEFEKQLDDLMQKHKSLWEFHNEKRLILETIHMEERRASLLIEENEEKYKLAEVLQAAEALRSEDAARSAEDTFLRSEEAGTALRLFQEENVWSKAKMAAASERYAPVLQDYSRWRNELEAAGVNPENCPKKTLCNAPGRRE